MKLSAWVFITDLLPQKKRFFHKVIAEPFLQANVFGKNEKDTVLKALKRSGIDGVELLIPRKIKKDDFIKVKKILDKYSIPVLSVHQPLEYVLRISYSEIEKLFEAAKFFNAKVIVIHLKAISSKLKNEKFMSDLKKLEKKTGIKIGIENDHKNPLSFLLPYISRPEQFSKVVKDQDLSVTLDTSHLAQCDGDIVDFYKKNKNNIINIHLSDYKKNFINRSLFLNKDMHLPIGKGELSIKKLLEQLNKEKYQGLVTLEVKGLGGIVESAKFVKSSK